MKTASFHLRLEGLWRCLRALMGRSGGEQPPPAPAKPHRARLTAFFELP